MKPYYTCPVKAEYMKKYFGMKFQYLCPVDSEFVDIDDGFASLDRIYIHPSSMDLLRYREGNHNHFFTPEGL